MLYYIVLYYIMLSYISFHYIKLYIHILRAQVRFEAKWGLAGGEGGAADPWCTIYVYIYIYTYV